MRNLLDNTQIIGIHDLLVRDTDITSRIRESHPSLAAIIDDAGCRSYATTLRDMSAIVSDKDPVLADMFTTMAERVEAVINEV